MTDFFHTFSPYSRRGIQIQDGGKNTGSFLRQAEKICNRLCIEIKAFSGTMNIKISNGTGIPPDLIRETHILAC